MSQKELYQRVYHKPKESILLLGPRGTGKSTFLKHEAQPKLIIDLLRQDIFRELSLHPERLESRVAHLKRNETILIDEIQKIPSLLDEVHRLVEDLGFVFYLTGSSARKLKRNGVNLLAGRALSRKMYPLTLQEIGATKKISTILEYGSLPKAVAESNPELANDFLFSYVETYLKEEIFQEGLSRHINDFSKFVELAGQYQGQILNYENIAREVGKSGDTIQSWFQILEDTLVGYRIEPYPLNIATKETRHPRFYFFDCGIARAAEGLSSLQDFPERKGFYFETLILNELKAYLEVSKKKYKIHYYNISSLGDIDFIIELRKKTMSSQAKLLGIEVKLTKKWNSSFEKMSKKVFDLAPKKFDRMIAIYLGDSRITHRHIEVFPLNDFIQSLWAGHFF